MMRVFCFSLGKRLIELDILWGAGWRRVCVCVEGGRGGAGLVVCSDIEITLYHFCLESCILTSVCTVVTSPFCACICY